MSEREDGGRFGPPSCIVLAGARGNHRVPGNGRVTTVDHAAVEWPEARILAVDDVADYLELLAVLLGRIGYTAVRTTTDPGELLACYREEQPDLVLLDLHMSGIDGFELIGLLREATPADHHVPILAVTADRSPETRRRALQIGAHDFLDKTLDETELGLRVRNLLRTRKQHLLLRQRGQRLAAAVDEREADLELYRHVVESIEDAVVIEGTDGKVIYANIPLSGGAIGRDMQGREWTNGGLVKVGGPVLRGELSSLSFEGTLEDGDGRSRPVDVVVQGVAHRGEQLLVAVARDVSGRKQAERALAEAADREREAADHLRRLDELKNSLLSAVNHELRTPLTTILAVAKTLETRRDAALLESLTPPLVRNAEELQKLLDDLLDVDRVMNGSAGFETRRADLAEIVREVASAIPLGNRRLVLDTAPTEATVDVVRYERIVANLLRNAVRHTPDDATITVRLQGGDPIRLTVQDTGPGVDDDLKESIFDPFIQGALRDPHQPGTGVGLSLVRSFAQLHGGRAWVEDAPGGGAAFHVEVLADGPSPAAPKR